MAGELQESPDTARPLGTLHVAAIVVGAIVGVGIFFTPGSLARALPSPAWVLGVWLLGGVASVAGAFVFAELGGRFPRAGGLYVFLREGFGPRAGPFVASSTAGSSCWSCSQLKFLENILLELKKAGILDSKKGKGGVYFLMKDPAKVKWPPSSG